MPQNHSNPQSRFRYQTAAQMSLSEEELAIVFPEQIVSSM